MEVETPIAAKKVQNMRKSFLNASVVLSPLRRNTLGGASPVVLLERSEVDDEKERSQRRSAVAMRRRLTNIQPPNTTPLSEISLITDETQIQDHLRICTKLYTENKISTKNAWELHIIDMIRKITSTDNSNVLQVAGTSLDISAKVYAFRVDDVHTRGLQLASSMSRVCENQQNEGGENGDTGDGADQQSRKKTTVKKKRRQMTGDKKNILDKEGKNLFANPKELESVLFATKENIEVSATDNLFTYKLHTDPTNQQFMLMSQKSCWPPGPDLLLEHFNKEIDLEISSFPDFALCLPFKDFEIGEWDPEEEEKQLANGITLNDVVLDENGLPMAELDGSMHDIFAEDNHVPEDAVSEVEEHHEEFQAQIHGEIAHIVDTIPEESRIATDYGYNTLIKTNSGKFIDRIWAGPSHWKVKFNRRSAARYSGSTVQQVVRSHRRVKVQEKIDFNVEVEDLSKKIGKYVIKRTPPTVAIEKVTLPLPELSFENFHKRTAEFLTKPGVPYPRVNGVTQTAEEYDLPTYNYENPNDSQYCVQHGTDDGIDNGEPMSNSFENEEGAPLASQNFLGDNLVNAPEIVPMSQVPYALQAKKMDMKKLKAAVWKLLTQDCEAPYKNGAVKAVVRPTQFSQLYRDLPSLLTNDMVRELSCPLAFVALLHLCNENNLELKAEPTYKDFCIIKSEG